MANTSYAKADSEHSSIDLSAGPLWKSCIL